MSLYLGSYYYITYKIPNSKYINLILMLKISLLFMCIRNADRYDYIIWEVYGWGGWGIGGRIGGLCWWKSSLEHLIEIS